jgi:septum formation protein
MTMRALDEAAIGRYLAAAGPAVLSSVGAYQIEGIGIHLFETIEGDHSTILGLPLLAMLKGLRAQQALAI